MASISEHTAPKSASPADLRWSTTVWIVAATLLSFVYTGYIPLSGNNIYHLPILSGAYDLPQFHDDGFVQSLRNFSSGFWIIFADTASLIDPKLLLGCWLVMTHALFLGAFVHLARSLGYDDPKLLAAFVILIAVSSLSVGEAAGGGGLMLESFTHSEVANASMLMTFSFAVTKRYGLVLFFGCVTFFLNAFMAVWAVGPILAIAIYHVVSGQLSPVQLIRRALPGTVGLLLVVPVLGSILSNHESLTATSFSYPDYLWGFFPAHFFISSLGLMALVEAACLVAALIFSARAHHKTRSELMALTIGAGLVLLLGVLAPLFTGSRTILNLHLIRSFVMLHLLGELTLALFALRRIFSPQAQNDRLIGLTAAGLLLLPRPAWIVVIPVLLFDLAGGRKLRFARPYHVPVRTAVLVLVGVCIMVLPIRAYRKLAYTQTVTRDLAQGEQLGVWASQNTAPSARFLMPQNVKQNTLLGFSYTATRQIWTDYKFGAAVMWSPSYYVTWKTRRDAVLPLIDVAGLVGYAKAQGIEYVISQCGAVEPTIYRYGALCVYAGAGERG